MQYMISINRRLDLSGKPWAVIINGVQMSLYNELPTQKQLDEDAARLDVLMRKDDIGLEKHR